jgi:hypothetical protein
MTLEELKRPFAGAAVRFWNWSKLCQAQVGRWAIKFVRRIGQTHGGPCADARLRDLNFRLFNTSRPSRFAQVRSQ